MHEATLGNIDAMHIAFPCTTASVARHFQTDPPGPPPVRDAAHPDGLPLDRLHPEHVAELAAAELLLTRTVSLALAARNSPAKTTIIFENPADRSIVGSNQHSKELEMHGSIFRTKQFLRLLDGLRASGGYSSCTFAYCRLGGDSQKYTTLYYTNDAATVLDQLNESRFQCNHERNAHAKRAGGRAPDGSWLSTPAATYPEQLVVRLCMAITFARTGSVQPIAVQLAAPDPIASHKLGTYAPLPPQNSTLDPSAAPYLPPDVPLAPDVTPLAPDVAPAATPIAFRGFTSPVARTRPALAPPTLPSTAPHGVISLGGGIPTVPKANHVQGRAARASTRSQRPQMPTLPDSPLAPGTPSDSLPPMSPSFYVPFGGSPGDTADTAGDMEAQVAELIHDSALRHNRCVADAPLIPVGDWLDVDAKFMAGIQHACIAQVDGTLVCDADVATTGIAAAAAPSVGAQAALLALLAHVQGVSGMPRPGVPAAQWAHEMALRADSVGAPKDVYEALARGGAWPAAVQKELTNHHANGSWEKIPLSQLPPGRRLNKLVWVAKVKRDGTAKMRLCVQGCTLIGGIDYEQTFSSALRTASARTIFAAAARYGLSVRSIDLVAAYLQGLLTEGEEVYCHLPPGSEEKGFCVKIVKPIYGMPQSGRRLQRLLVPWLTDTMGLRRLDDSDDCVYIYDAPTGSDERFLVGIYVDNLQIATSALLDANGNALDANSFYAKFIAAVHNDWDVIDEGEMIDLLSIQVRRNDNGSITLHMSNFIDNLLGKYLPDGPSSRVQEKSMPYTNEFEARLAVALSLGSTAEPAYPDLVKPYQQRLGSLMYLAGACRPDLGFCVSKHCTCMARPTPDLMKELEHTFSYLARHKHVGLTYDAGHAGESNKLQGMSDADWGTRFSTSGWVIKWQGAAIAWGSKKQDCVALSTCEAEIIALSEAAKDMVYFKKLVTGIDPNAVTEPPLVATDNKGAQDTSYNSEHHSRMKHVKRRHFFIRDMVESFELRVPLVSTDNNYSDFLTKAMKNTTSFLKQRALVMNEPPR